MSQSGHMCRRRGYRVFYTPHPEWARDYQGYVSRVKWSNPEKGVAPSPTPRCSSYWKGSRLVALDYSRQLYFTLYGDPYHLIVLGLKKINIFYLEMVKIYLFMSKTVARVTIKDWNIFPTSPFRRPDALSEALPNSFKIEGFNKDEPLGPKQSIGLMHRESTVMNENTQSGCVSNSERQKQFLKKSMENNVNRNVVLHISRSIFSRELPGSIHHFLFFLLLLLVQWLITSGTL